MVRCHANPGLPTLLRFWVGWAGGVLKNSMMDRCFAVDAGCFRFSMLAASSCKHVLHVLSLDSIVRLTITVARSLHAQRAVTLLHVASGKAC